eukprot:Ihof_evm1s403 gene=Ihof_evmTU1s403
MGETFKTIPEIFESSVSECLAFRTKSLAKIGGLGPPDLCHVTKVQERTQGLFMKNNNVPPSQLGTYHYVYGLDVSSPAYVAAYFNTLLNDSVKGPGAWRVQSGTYCSYNAFARVDVRIEVTMPGTVNAYVLDGEGRRFGCDDRIWQEVHVCAMLRVLSMPSPITHHIDALRIVPYLTDPRDEAVFILYAKKLFWDGRYLGTNELTAPITNINNRLAVGVKDYYYKASRYDEGMSFFQQFLEQDGEVATIIAEGLDQLGQTTKAIGLLAKSLVKMPQSYAMLMKQSQLLVTIDDIPTALDIAKLVVDLAPAQAQPWINLALTYTAAKNYPMALVALNVTPMVHGSESHFNPMLDPAQITNNNEILREMIEAEEEGDQELISLPATNLKGTYIMAYGVITRMLAEITWDDLLTYRSKVFLMEEEYAATFRQQTVLPNGSEEGEGKGKIGGLTVHENGETKEGENGKEEEGEGEEKTSSPVDKPSKPSAASLDDTPSEDKDKETVAGGKRLLERWLDQLFTALYQDLMCSVIWNAQESHARKNNIAVFHTVGDHLRYGIVTERLNRKDEALLAYQQCTEQAFCLRGLLAILDIYSRDGFVEETMVTLDSIHNFYDKHPSLPVPRE